MNRPVDVLAILPPEPSAARHALRALREARCALPFSVVAIGDGGAMECESGVDRAENLRAALARHPDRDVVLVRGAVEVPDGWLDRLAACARRESRAATVTPFSNDPSICGYPRLSEPNVLPPGTSAADLDRHFARENAGLAIDLPWGADFCVFIARSAFEEVEPPEGDDVMDFCMRASRAGFRHLLCADLFVRHDPQAPGGSGAKAGESLPELESFRQREPSRPLRRRVDLARLRSSPRPRLLFVTHRWGGGVERHVQDLARLLADDCEVLVLRPDVNSTVVVRWLRENEEFAAWFDAMGEWNACVDLLRSLGVARIHFHHVHGLPRSVLDLPAALGVAYDVTLHDHFPMCPQYHLADEDGRYCGEPDEEGCRACVTRRPSQWHLDIAEWRDLFRRLLQDAGRVIAPSQDIARRIGRHVPSMALHEWPHPEYDAALPATPFQVVLLGGVSPIKGLAVLEACVADAKRRRLPLHFHVIGHVDRATPAWPEAPLTIGGSYREDELGAHIAQARPDAFLFLSQVPESYSYTLSVAMKLGLPIVATDMGAFAERLRAYQPHALVQAGAAGDCVNEALLALARPARAARARVTVAAAD